VKLEHWTEHDQQHRDAMLGELTFRHVWRNGLVTKLTCSNLMQLAMNYSYEIAIQAHSLSSWISLFY